MTQNLDLLKKATITTKKKRSWNAREKLTIITFFEKNPQVSKCNVATKFNIEPKQLRDWLKKKEQLLLAKPHIKKLTVGAKPQYPILEVKLFQWVKFLCSNKNNHHHTMIAQRLPEDLVEKQYKFLNFILYHHIQHDYPLKLIGNIDETPLTFDIPSNITVEETGARTVSIRTTGHEKSNFTVVLSCMENGNKLLPLIIFKLVNVPQQIFPSGVMICTNRGLTSKLQPLDVSINKSFKNKYRQCYNNWIAEEIKKLTPTGRIQLSAYNLVAEWVKTSWDNIDPMLIQRSFKCCGISNSRDGSEDKYIFDYDWMNGKRKSGNTLPQRVLCAADYGT
ncbi:982_t:CDS:2 [Diversispora eburnea]|uniref:982_t:CDS:1 n=1 Tax=Diversispora eburnea TaxID=1213867 RepID=A0A9N8WDV8_9GLOM|nr:982_t:CDS:2 [Diversispora eburnea]